MPVSSKALRVSAFLLRDGGVAADSPDSHVGLMQGAAFRQGINFAYSGFSCVRNSRGRPSGGRRLCGWSWPGGMAPRLAVSAVPVPEAKTVESPAMSEEGKFNGTLGSVESLGTAGLPELSHMKALSCATSCARLSFARSELEARDAPDGLVIDLTSPVLPPRQSRLPRAGLDFRAEPPARGAASRGSRTPGVQHTAAHSSEAR